jgi:NAD(P)-dependent dehydrogenase (short-subunit alcohol dehydrogenase family)
VQEIRGWVAAVTGAGSGIGRALALELAREGCELALCDVDTAGLEATRAAVAATGAPVSAQRVDVAQSDDMVTWADAVASHHRRVNLVVNNAGVSLVAQLRHITFDELDWLMGINFRGVVHGTLAFLPHLERAGQGHVVNVSSVFGLIAFPGHGAYNAAKFAVRGFTECLAMELAIEGSPIGVSCVHPGGIRTRIARNARMGSREPTRDQRALMERDFDEVARTTPERAARAIVAGVRRRRRRVLIGADAHMLATLQRLAPVRYQTLVGRAVARRQRADGPASLPDPEARG